MKYLLLVILVFLVACGSTKIIEKEVPIEKVKTEYINTLKIDSVYIHDSIDRFVNGDTLYLYKYKTAPLLTLLCSSLNFSITSNNKFSLLLYS